MSLRSLEFFYTFRLQKRTEIVKNTADLKIISEDQRCNKSLTKIYSLQDCFGMF